MREVKLIIHGNLLSKSNSRIMTRINGHPRLIKSSKAGKYIEAALWELKSQLAQHEMFEGPVLMDITIWYSSRRPDLDVSLVQDIFEKAGVYKNDRQVFEIIARKELDKDNPRLEATIKLL